MASRTFAAPAGSPGAHHAYGALLLQYYLTYPLALAGALLLARERRSLRGRLGDLLGYVLAHAVVSDGNFRLAAPLYLLLCLFAGHTIAWVGARPRVVDGGTGAGGSRPGRPRPAPAAGLATGPAPGGQQDVAHAKRKRAGVMVAD